MSNARLSSASTRISRVKSWFIGRFGGAARFRLILLLGAVLGLDSAEKGTVSAVSDQLRAGFHIGNMQIGLLLAVASFITAVAAPPN